MRRPTYYFYTARVRVDNYRSEQQNGFFRNVVTCFKVMFS